MKITKWLKFAGLISTLAAAVPDVAADKPLTRRGTSVMHYMTRNALVSTEAGSNVVGWVRLQMNEQGGSSKQSLELFATGLAADTPCNLIAVAGEETNATPVDEVLADQKGRLRLKYKTNGQGNGGRSQDQIPEALRPLVDVRSLGLENASTQTLAYAWIADADKFELLVKRNLSPEDTNGTAAGQLSLVANQRKVQFWLLAGGLSATNNYHLALNSEIVDTVAANVDGRVEIKGWPTNAPAILDLRSLSLLDGSSNVVLSTTLPK